MTKRGRTDGHLSKEEYARLENDNFAESGEPSNSSDFVRATPNTLGARRMLKAKVSAKKEQFAKHLYALNTSFYSWLKDQVATDPSADLSDGFQDYVDHCTSLEDRYLRTYGEVLTFGSGDCGQLAHGTEKSEDLEVRYPRVVFSLRDKKVVGIACGGIHNAIYTAQGHVYTWGCSDDGSLGRMGDENIPILVGGLVQAGASILRVACGDGQTIAVSAKGEVWGWGCYKDKEGKKWFNPSPTAPNIVKDVKKQQNTPLLITGLPLNVVEVACGASFNLAMTADGRAYSWGIGECGELGRPVLPLKTGEGEDCEYDLAAIYKGHVTPAQMLMGSDKREVTDVHHIGCGAYHAMITILGDTVLACGLNNYGQLGMGDTTNRDLLFEVNALSGRGIISLKGGMHHSLVSSSTGAVYSFGRGDSGQLGSSEASTRTAGDFSSLPVRVTLPNDTHVVQIDCGGNHNLALTEKSEVYTWGYGDMLALGHGEEKDEVLPKKLNFTRARIKNITITQVAGGGQHSAIIGRVVST